MREKRIAALQKLGISAKAADKYLATEIDMNLEDDDVVEFKGVIMEEEDQEFFESIGFNVVSAKSLQARIGKPRTITMIVNSPGGSVMELAGIIGVIRDFREGGGKINARIVGIAASAATVVTSIVDTVAIEALAVFMVHPPYGVTHGDARQVENFAKLLQNSEKQMINAYQEKTGQSIEAVTKDVLAEKYYTAEEAKEFGYVDSILPIPKPDNQEGGDAGGSAEPVDAASRAMRRRAFIEGFGGLR